MVKMNLPANFASDPIWGKKHINMPDMDEIIEITKSEASATNFLLEMGILRIPTKCGECGEPVKQMSGNPNSPDYLKVRCCRSKKHTSGKPWKQSARKGTIVEGSHLSAVKFVRFVWFWLQKVRLGAIKNMLKLSAQTVTDWNQFLSEFVEIVYTDSRRSGGKIGGPGIIVHIDESKFGKRKYHVSFCCVIIVRSLESVES